MKQLKVFAFSIVLLIVLGACSPAFPLLVDTRPPTATPVATETPILVPTPEPTPTLACLIKGNVNSAGEKIYHVPGQPTYNQTKINPAEGDVWFCSEQEAQDADFRKALR